MSVDDINDHAAGCGEDAAAPYVLGALTEPEHAAFVEHLRTCSSCREEVAALQSVANALPAAVPQLHAPDHLRGRVMATVQTEAGLRNPDAGRAVLLRRPAQRAPWRLALGGLAATAAIVAIVLLAVRPGSGSATRVYHAQVSAAPGATATLRVNDGHGTLQIARMPKTTPGHVYEVWLKRAGKPLPTDALFTVSSAGKATVAVPGDLNGVSVVMVTAEPDGGSSAPTSAPVIVANV
jgi:anti-sigma-K factor RskA